ncbi:hypothetical protein [Bradyrhizobium sp. RT5a]|uniref:hypothetical protein n=1 Tax=Bradyrhizobium sp. RT5a TaxID=3156380 RepID=UPI003393E64E
MNAVTPLPVEIDPRPCELCGLTIDRHQMIDEGEGPEFFCIDVPVDELTLDELARRDELRRLEACAAMVRDWEMDDPRDSWRWTGAPRPVPQATRRRARAHHQPPASIITAFLNVVRLDQPDTLSKWIADHPAEAPQLLSLYEAKHALA